MEPFKPSKIKTGGRGGSRGVNPLELLIARDILKQQEEERKAGLEKERQTASQEARLGTRTLSADERADLQVFDTINGYVGEIEGLMDRDPNRFQEAFSKANLPFDKLTTLGDKEAIDLNRALGDWADLILRARSKSQTTEKELQRIRGFGVPSLRDVSVTQDPVSGETFPTIRKLLRNVKGVTSNNRQRIIQGIGYETGGQSPIPGMNQQGAVDPIQAILERRKQRKP